MELKDVIKLKNKKDIQYSIRTTTEKKNWMRENDISPQLVFDIALEELMEI